MLKHIIDMGTMLQSMEAQLMVNPQKPTGPLAAAINALAVELMLFANMAEQDARYDDMVYGMPSGRCKCCMRVRAAMAACSVVARKWAASAG